VRAGLITEEDALSKANHPQEFRAFVTPHQDYRLQGADTEGGR
jgi:hypothetical protein